MTISRRALLFSSMAVLPVIGGGIAAAVYFNHEIEADIQRSIRSHFGTNISKSPEAAEFIKEFANDFREKNGVETTRLLSRRLIKSFYLDESRTEFEEFSDVVIERFIVTTNAVRAFETGGDLVFLGLNATLGPCENTWGANWL